MEFGWINLFGALLVVVMLIPNIVFAVKHTEQENQCKSLIINLIEQVGRYACMLLMWFPLLVWEFCFSNVFEMLCYIIISLTLIFSYLIVWVFYFKNQSLSLALALAIIPTALFFICGLLLKHWLLVIFAILFGVGHIYITYKNNK